MCAIGALGGAALLGLAAVVWVANLAAGPFFSLSTKAWAVERHGDKLVGRVQGAIKATENATATVRVASGFLGLRSLAIVITEETEIPVGGKLGGIGDLDRGQLVKIAYEVLEHHLVARRVEVLDRLGSSDPVMPVETVADTTAIAPTAVTPTAVTPRVVLPTAVAPTPVPPAVSDAEARQKLSPRSPASPPRTVSPPKRQKTAAPPKKRTTAARSSSPRTPAANAPRSAPAQSGVSRVPRTADDGAAAIDWLPKGRIEQPRPRPEARS
jgi:hypothetical protein